MTEALLTRIEEALKVRKELKVAEAKEGEDAPLWSLRERVQIAEAAVDKAFKEAMKYHLDDLLRERENDRKWGSDW